MRGTSKNAPLLALLLKYGRAALAQALAAVLTAAALAQALAAELIPAAVLARGLAVALR